MMAAHAATELRGDLIHLIALTLTLSRGEREVGGFSSNY
jgi:hypothetical protein